MTPAIRALAWEILARYRWFVGGSAAWLLVACLITALLPESARGPNMVALLLAPAMLGPVLFLTAVTHGEETRLDTRAGEFPRRLLLLPVTAGTLAGIPLALTLGVSTLVWVVTALGVLRPCRVPAPVFWPGLHFGVAVAWMLALSWSPMPFRWARLVFASVVVIAFFIGAGFLAHYAVPEYAILLGLAVLARIAVGLGVRGVSRSRCEGGENSEAAPPVRRGEGVSIEPFRSPLRAQLWLEWRTHGRMLAILTFVLGLFLVAAAAMSEHVLRTQPEVFQVITTESARSLGPAWFGLSWLLMVPIIFAGAGGGEMGRFSRTQRTAGVPAFVGLLPVSTANLVKAKFIAPLLHLGLSWGILVALALGWAVLGGHSGDMAERLTAVCGSPEKAWLTLLATLLSAYLVSYLICVESMWGGLLGWPVTASLPALVGMLELVAAVVIVRKWEPGYWPMLLTCLWVGLAVKLLLAEWLLYYARKRVGVGRAALAGGVLIWAACTAVPAGRWRCYSASRRRRWPSSCSRRWRRVWRPRRCCTGHGMGVGREAKSCSPLPLYSGGEGSGVRARPARIELIAG